MDKITRAINLINYRVPKYYKFSFRYFKTVHLMLRKTAKEIFNNDYKKCINYYEEYFKSSKTDTYIKKTKYFKRLIKQIYKKKSFQILALSGDMIDLALDNLRQYKFKYIVFILLHEIGHIYYRTKFKDQNIKQEERKCDLFAIRWCRRLIKEGLLKEKF